MTRIGKSSKSKSMALKAKSNDTDESSDDEDSKMKSYITRQFKKLMKNANGKGFNKDQRQSSSSQFKSQDKGKNDARDGDQYTVPSGPKCFRCQGFGHMKQESPIYLKTIGKIKALATTLSDTEPEDDPNSKDDGILNAFTITVNPTRGLLKMCMKKRTWWSLSLRRWMNKITSTQSMQSYIRSQKNMRSCIGWLLRSLVMWSLSEKKSLQCLIKPIRILEH